MATQSQLEACAARIAKGVLSTDTALKLLAQVNDRAERMRETGASDPVLEAAQQLAAEKLRKAQNDRIDALRNAAKRAVPLAEIRAKGGIGAAIRVLEAMEVWTPLGGGRLDSIESKGDWLSRDFIAPMLNRLKRAGLLDVAISGRLDNEVNEAIWRKSGGAPDKNIQISAPAQQIADEIYGPLREARTRLNGAGARIGDPVDYVSRTIWDARQLRAVAGPAASAEEAFQAWWAKDGPRMADKTFENLEPNEGETMDQAKLRFARAVFEGRTTGIVHTFRGTGMAEGGDYVPPAFEGTKNLGLALSHQRTIYWKSAKDWADHMREFGGGHSTYYNALNSLLRAGRDVAIMDKLGTNPGGSWNMIKDALLHEYRGDIDGVNKFKQDVRRLDKIMDRLDGTREMPHNKFLADLAETAAMIENMGKLGFVQLTHAFAAPMTVSAELAHHGAIDPLRLTAIPRVIGAILHGAGPAERAEVIDELGAFTHGGMAAVHGSWSQSSPGVPGFLSFVHSNFMRATGLPWLIDRIQAYGVKAVLSNKLGRAANYADLNVHIQALLQRYGIRPEDFNLLQAAEVDGRKYLTPAAPMRADAAAIEQRLRDAGRIAEDATPQQIAKQVQAWRWDTSDKLGMYLNDAAQHATVTPGARERAAVYGKLAPGSLQWLLLRSFAQFKMWPLAAWNQIIMREFGYALSGKQIAWGLGSILGLSMIGGAMRMATRDALSGRPQRNYLDPQTMLAALAQGGGLGLYGDFLFGETSRFGSSIWSSILGPQAADFERLARIAFRFKQDLHDNPNKAMEHMWPDLAHFASANTPFANLAYLKGATDYLLWYHLFEAASPGWWERTNRRLLRQQGRTMSGYEPGGEIPWTPWAIGAPTYQPYQ